MTDDHPTIFSIEDWGLIVEALAQWAGPPDNLDTPQQERAYELIDAIARMHDRPASALIIQPSVDPTDASPCCRTDRDRDHDDGRDRGLFDH